MARSVRARIEARSPRLRLSGRKEPYWATIERGLAVGYHRPLRGGSGTWWARVLVDSANGRTTYRSTALGGADDHADGDGETVLNWRQAQDAARAWAAKQTKAGPLTVEMACREYVEDLRIRKGEQAAREAEGRIRKRLLPVLGNKRLAELTVADVRSWHSGLVEGEDEETVRKSRDTANRLLSIAKAAFNFAFNGERVADDRAWRRVKAFRGVGEARKVILTETELQRLVDASEPGLRELVLIGAWTGARLGEITSAPLRAFDSAAATLRVQGKTGAREIHLPDVAVILLRRLAAGKRPDDRLFTNREGLPWTRSLHQRPFAEAVEIAGLDPETTFYTLRHSYISRALLAGVPTKAVADHCGTSAVMIERHYAKFIRSDQQRFAVVAAPQLRLDADSKKVVSIQPAGCAGA
jgi:integrase